jgi:hypothetical protein
LTVEIEMVKPVEKYEKMLDWQMGQILWEAEQLGSVLVKRQKIVSVED